MRATNWGTINLSIQVITALLYVSAALRNVNFTMLPDIHDVKGALAGLVRICSEYRYICSLICTCNMILNNNIYIIFLIPTKDWIHFRLDMKQLVKFGRLVTTLGKFQKVRSRPSIKKFDGKNYKII